MLTAAQNVTMTVLNVVVLVVLLVFGVFAVYNNKPNFELTPEHLYDQKKGQQWGIWVFIFIIISGLVTLPGVFGPLSNGWLQTLWWVELIANVASLVCCCVAIFYYHRLNTRPHD